MAGNIKEKILEATLALADEKGIGRVSISQIAERVGLKKSSIYSHFSSKEEIIEAMYLHFRNNAVKSRVEHSIDYGTLVEGHTLKEVLLMAVSSYMSMNEDTNMNMFYRVILSERTRNPVVAEILVAETNTMILATKQLFYAMQAKKVAQFDNPDGAAFAFAMGVHATMDFIGDAELAGSRAAENAMESYIDEFCRIYGEKK